MSLQLYMGCMFSGKTTEMFRQVRKHVCGGDIPLIVRFAGDTRYSRAALASSHDAVQMEAMCTEDPWCDDDVRMAADHADVIGVDEGQFMAHLAEFCAHYASRGKHVVVAALDGTFDQRAWPEVTRLIPLADHVCKLHAVCVVCHGTAAFTRRLDAQNTRVCDIGGADKYIACCRTCHALKVIPADALERHKHNLARINTLVCSK